MLPPLPLTTDELRDEMLLEVFLKTPSCEGRWPHWAEVRVCNVDPRIANCKQAEVFGLARNIEGLGTLVIGEMVCGALELTVRLLHRGRSGKDTVHWLTNFDGRAVAFDNKDEAVMCLNEIATGTWGWLWYPRIQGTGAHLNGGWTFHPGDEAWANDEVRARWEGRQGYFTAGQHSGCVRLYLSGRQLSLNTGPLLDPTGQPLTFPDLSAARSCAEQWGRSSVVAYAPSPNSSSSSPSLSAHPCMKRAGPMTTKQSGPEEERSVVVHYRMAYASSSRLAFVVPKPLGPPIDDASWRVSRAVSDASEIETCRSGRLMVTENGRSLCPAAFDAP